MSDTSSGLLQWTQRDHILLGRCGNNNSALFYISIICIDDKADIEVSQVFKSYTNLIINKKYFLMQKILF